VELQHLGPAEQAVSPAPVKELQAAQRALAILLAPDPLPALFRSLARTAAEAAGADLASIELLAPDRQALMLAAAHGLPATSSECVSAIPSPGEGEAAMGAPRLLAPVFWPSCDLSAVHRHVVPLGDYEGVRAWVAFPIAASGTGGGHDQGLDGAPGGRLLGRLTLYFRRPFPLLPVEIERGRLHAQILVALLERERRAAEQERRAAERAETGRHAQARQSQLFAELAHDFAETGLAYQPLLEILARRIAEACACGCTVHLIAGDGVTLIPAALHHQDPEVASALREILGQLAICTDDPVYDVVLRSERPTLIAGVELAHKMPALREYVARTGIDNVLFAPLRVHGRLLGLLSACRRAGTPPFTTEDEHFLQKVADVAALAIENARLHTSLEEQRRHLEDVIQHMPCGVAIAEAPSGRIMLMNDLVETLHRAPIPPAQSFADYQPQDFYRRDGSQYQLDELPLVRALRHGEVIHNEDQTLKRGEDYVVLRVSAAPLYDAHGQIRHAVAAFFDVTEERRTEEFLEAALGSIEDYFAMYDRDWRYVYANDKAAKILGQPREALLGRRIWDVSPEAVGTLFYRECHRAMREQSIIHFESYYAPWDRWFESHLYPSRLGLSVFATDITDRKRTEAELMHARLLFQRITEAMPDVLFVYDMLEERAVYMSHNLPRLLGYSPEQIAAMSRSTLVTEVIHPEDKPLIIVTIERLQKLGDGEVEEYEVRCRHADGSYRWIRSRDVVFSRTPEGRVQQILGIAQDVTAERRALDALRESEALYRTLGEAVPDFIWLMDTSGRILYANQRWRDYTGFSLEKLDKDSLYRLDHPEDVPGMLRQWHDAAVEGRVFTSESRIRRHDGVYRWFLCRAVPVRDERGVIQKWVGTTTDIDDRRRAEEALKEADHRKDEFLAMLSHELRNPLAPIQTAVELLRLQSGAAPGVARACDIIVRQTRHLTRLVEDLLEVSRITRGDIRIERQGVDAASLCARAVETAMPFITARGHHFVQHLPEAPIELMADPTRIAQVLANLLHNAAKYTDPGGRIELSVARDSGQAVGQRDDQEGDQVVFRVRDSGIGIPPDMLERIFDPFTQIDHSLDRSQGGLGIGLTLVRKLVALHGGSVHAASRGPGHGAEFIVRLPALPAAERMCEPLPRQVSPLAPPSVTTSAPAPRRILLVDDNQDAAETLAEILTLWGHEVHMAHDGETALERYRELEPEVVLLDIGLPKLDGYEVARRLREAPHPPRLLVALTGYGQAEDRRRSSEAGFDHHLVKPFDPSILIPLLAHLP
jgi:PAS domain S-box-containing protein